MIPDYRIRLFLSVDLVGSTAFKVGAGSDHKPQNDREPRPLWLAETTKFYSWFSSEFISKFKKLASIEEGQHRFSPKVWKTIGDEIIFVCTIDSIHFAAIVVNAFIDTLFSYRIRLRDFKIPLDVKGSGWTAAFPAPNTTLSLKNLSDEPLLSAPEYEASADENPIEYDYLGMAIDCGFRVSKVASAERMPLTVELAALLSEAAIRGIFPSSLLYNGRHLLRGVLGDRPYPIIYIDTERSPSRRLVISREEALTGKHDLKPEAVRDFVFAFMKDEGIEFPYFAGEAEFSAIPSSYEAYKKRQTQVVKEIEKEDEARNAAQLGQETDGENGGELPPDVAKQLGIETSAGPETTAQSHIEASESQVAAIT